MEKNIAEQACDELKKLATKRRPLEIVWQKILEMIDPANAFITKKYHAVEIWNEDIYSTVAQRALPKFVAALQSTVTPPNERWHRLIPPLNRLKDNQKCKGYLENVTDNLFEMRYRPSAGFNKAIIKIWNGYGKLGLGVMFVDEDREGNGTIYEAVNIKDFYPVMYANNTLKKCYRKIKKQAWEVMEDLEAKGINPQTVLPKEVLKNIENDPNIELDLVHMVKRLSLNEVSNNTMRVKRVDGSEAVIKYRYVGYLILTDTQAKKPVVLETGYFFSCPYQFTRYQPLDYDIYSNTPTLQALPDIKMMQRMRKSVIESAEKAVDPPLLARADAAFGGLMPIAGAIMPDTLDPEGREMLKPLITGDSVKIGIDMEELITKGIEDFYLVPLYMMYYQEGKMTATEINQRAMERAMIMSINVFPIENELLDPMVERELDIMHRQGKLDLEDMPQELKELLDADNPFCAIQYEGEQHKAQELIKANGIATTMQGAVGLSNFDPHVALAFKSYDCLQKLAEANGMPSDLLYDKDEYDSRVQERVEAEQQAAAMDPVDAGAADVAGDVSANYARRLSNVT